MDGKKCLICAVFLWMLGFVGISQAREAQANAGGVFPELPVHLYTPAGQKPILAFSTPCMELAKLDHGVGPLASMRELMAAAVVQTSQVLPIDLQPVCR